MAGEGPGPEPLSGAAARHRHRMAVWGMVIAPLMWSMAGAVSRQLSHAKSFEVTFWRSLFTVLSLGVILPLWRGRGWWRALHWRSPWFWLSGLCWCGMFTTFMLALTQTTVANVLLIMSIAPLLTAMLTRVFLGHRLGAVTWGAIAVACVGMGVMFGSQADLMTADGGLSWGLIVAIFIPVSGSIQWTISQYSQSHGESLDLVPCVLLGAILSVMLTMPLSWPLQATAADLGWLGVLGLFQLAIPCLLAAVSAQILAAHEVALLSLLEVIFGILWAWLFANETPGPWVLVGGSLVMMALVVNALWQRGASR